MVDPFTLPDDLPRPVDDGAADHLAGMPMPPLELTATDGSTIRLDKQPGLTIVYAYPWTGRPDQPLLVDGWDLIPGARGCTPETCAFRDRHADLLGAGASAVYGLSTQDTAYQRELAERLHLPFPILSEVDAGNPRRGDRARLVSGLPAGHPCRRGARGPAEPLEPGSIARARPRRCG